ncbi:MAG: hypothetical protein HKO53_15270 [Gemmatimonadetes bacterium]|nr:hypothetical protein [Gemmatimonadota bacterium]NNM34437.1 hypothetical protein [Gemmatimonadota bacterium]
MKVVRIASAVGVLLLGTSCSEDTGVVPVSIEGTARVTGQVYLDGNGDGLFNPALDDPASGASVTLSFAASGAVIANGTTGPDGLFDFMTVPVATLQLAIGSQFLADSLVARFEQPDTFSVSEGDSLHFVIGVGAPERPISEVRALPPGEQVFTSGIALNGWPELDGALHLENGGYLRVTDVPSIDVGPGDSIRVSGRTALLEESVILTNGRAFILAENARPVTAQPVTTSVAGDASGGVLDAALVEMTQVMVLDTASVADGFLMVGSDGTGAVTIRVRESTGVELREVAPGQVFGTIRGVLVPASNGTWEVVPRSRDDADPPST